MFKQYPFFALGLLAISGLTPPAVAQPRIVGASAASCPNAQYNTIAAAVSAAEAGDEIDICPGTYPEQLIITKPLTLKGIAVNGIARVLVQPNPLADLAGLPFEAVITVMNTRGVNIQNLAIDASNNTVSGCGTSVAGISFLDASGEAEDNAIFGTQLTNPTSCPALFPGNGFGVQVSVDNKCGSCAPHVSIEGNSFHDFGRDAVLAVGAGIRVDVSRNSITGVGPSTGVFQFGIFIANGAVGRITENIISQQGCGTLSPAACFNLRSEGVVLRSAGDGTVIQRNIVTKAQFGFFLNGANAARITDNVIKDISVGKGIQLQGVTNSLIARNTISGVLPIQTASCGIFEPTLVNAPPPPPGASLTPDSGNIIRDNTVNDAYCGVAHVTADAVESGTYFNTLYTTLNTDQLAGGPYPPPTEP